MVKQREVQAEVITENSFESITETVYFVGDCSDKCKSVLTKSNFNLKCLPPKDFPITQDDVEGEALAISSSVFLKLLNKTKFAISNDETRHYLNGIYLHKTNENNQLYLSAVATDGHRLSKSRLVLTEQLLIQGTQVTGWFQYFEVL